MALVDWLLQDLWCSNLGRSDVTQVGSLGILSAAVLLEKVLGVLDHSVHVLTVRHVFIYVHLVV